MPISQDLVMVPLLAAVGVFAIVGLIWSLTEGYFEEQRKQQRP